MSTIGVKAIKYPDGDSAINITDGGNVTLAGTLGVTGVLTGTSLDISGNIDIDGTSNLDVVDIDGAVNMASTLIISGTTTIQKASSGGTANSSAALVIEGTDATKAHIQLLCDNSDVQSIYFGDAADNDIGRIAYDHTGNTMRFNVNAAERMRIDASGNVGIGTSSPASWARLDILGSGGAQTGATQALQVKAPNATAGQGVGIRLSATSGSHEAVGIIGMVNNASGNAGSMTFHTYNLGANIPERMRITSLGHVGIGTASPPTDYTRELNVHGTTNARIKISHDGIGNGVSDGMDIISAGNEAYLINRENGGIIFYTNNTIRSRIDSSGNYIQGNNATWSASQDVVMIESNGLIDIARNDLAAQNVMAFYNPNGGIGRIQTVNSQTNYLTTSDYRLKENVNYSFDATTELKKLKPARFNFIADPNETMSGFLAHEVQPVIPQAVSGVKDAVDKDGNIDAQGIDPSKLVPLLTKALQEAMTRIETLEAEVKALKG